MVREEDYLLSNQEIVGGIKAAIARGETLKDAMMTFYQAGYDKAEIEEAARAYISIQNPVSNMGQIDTNPRKQTLSKPEEKKEDVSTKNKKEKKFPKIPKKKDDLSGGMQNNQNKESQQKVSKYEAPKDKSGKPPGGKAITIVLILVLLILVGILAAVVLFKEELVRFFNSLFG